VTREGTFLVEDERVRNGLHKLRFNQNLPNPARAIGAGRPHERRGGLDRQVRADEGGEVPVPRIDGRMIAARWLFVAAVAGGALLAGDLRLAFARKKVQLPEPPPLVHEHQHAGGAVSFRVPEGWAVGKVGRDADAIQTVGNSLVVRIVYRRGGAGFDSFHASCMAERLAGSLVEAPAAGYEYDYVEGAYGQRRALDSAFLVVYDSEVMGHRKWRQRNLTVVGEGHSLCLVAFAPASVWKKSLEARSVLEAVLQNVKLRE
jgi:hypothetical protein